MPVLRNNSSKVHKAIHLLDLLTIQLDVQFLSLVSNPHHFCLLQVQSQSVFLEHPLPFLQHFLYFLFAIMTRSSAYIIFLRISIVMIFLLNSSITVINSKRLRALPCLKPMLTGNSSDNLDQPLYCTFNYLRVCSFNNLTLQCSTEYCDVCSYPIISGVTKYLRYHHVIIIIC